MGSLDGESQFWVVIIVSVLITIFLYCTLYVLQYSGRSTSVDQKAR